MSGYSALAFASTSKLTIALWHGSRGSRRNRPKSSGFAACQASPSPDLKRALFLYLQHVLPFNLQHVSYNLSDILLCIERIHAKGDLLGYAKLPELKTTIATHPLKSSRKRRNCMFTPLISINFPCSMVYTTHYLQDC